MPSPAASRRHIDVVEFADKIQAGDRQVLSRAITLVESVSAKHRDQAQQLLMKLLPLSGGSLRVGITGVPGVGKSTFIESLGMYLIGQGHKVAVLAVDPSSTRSKGSILGDKTRMAQLAVNPDAYIRPSPTSGTLGGVAKATRETMVLLEAAGFDIILVETVGVGQSEVTVHSMVDCFTFLTLARTGDQLQGIKKGVLELADLVAVNKADGPHLRDAQRAARELAGALRLVHPPGGNWTPPVITMSGLEAEGLDRFWNNVRAFTQSTQDTGEFETKRTSQRVEWMWQMVHDSLIDRFHDDPVIAQQSSDVVNAITRGEMTPAVAARTLLDTFDNSH